MKEIILLLRPHQWLKNSFVFLPLFFGKKLFEWDCLLNGMVAFLAFSFLASSIYCLNDLKDVETDRKHPEKSKRPIASGLVSRNMGLLIMFLTLCIAVVLSFMIQNPFRYKLLCILLIYFFMNVAYCYVLKEIAILDVITISTGFVLRILAGGFSTNIVLSQWIVLMTFLLSLFLALAKRRDDIVMYEKTGIKMRRNITFYNISFMDHSLGITASITLVCYIMYTVSPEVAYQFGTSYVYLTSIFVLMGILRYLQITLVDSKSGSPTKILIHDKFIHLCIGGWLIMFTILIYV